MNVNTKAMSGVPVRTKSGSPVGKVASFDLDADTGRLVTLRVKARGFVPGLLEDELIVSWSAILEMSEREVVVADASVREGAKALARGNAPATAPSLMSAIGGSASGGKEG